QHWGPDGLSVRASRLARWRRVSVALRCVFADNRGYLFSEPEESGSRRSDGITTASPLDVSIEEDGEKWIGKSIERLEDKAIVAGRGRFIDDLGTRPGTLAAAILRSPHAHAALEAVDCNAARAVDGVAAVITATEVRALTSSLIVGVKAPLECWPIAIDRVRYVGEPVAVVVASDRYRAEDALELIDVRYRQLPAVVDTLAATLPNAPLLHPAV